MTDTNTDPDGDDIVQDAAQRVAEETEPPMSLAEFVDEVLDHPEYACSAPEYLLRAIEYFGTRTVVEHGEEIQRWKFFDDPANDGEHAILGNTELLNEFVEELRGMARGPSNEAKMFWFEGPTATGKSELKRCFINGLNAFSKTDEGKRFTMEWNIASGQSGSRSMTYGDDYKATSDEYWHESPVQSNPLSVLPEETRRRVLYGEDSEPSLWTPPGLDPFSEEAYDTLLRRYDGDFEEATAESHLRVNRYHLDIGRGIGVLQSEDEGRPRQKLVGEWMHGMVKELDSRGRRNPQAMSYDGVLSQGNSGLTVIEDAGHHFDTILKTLSVPEDDEVKIDRRNVLPIDTVAVIISNPDMRSELMKTQDTADDSYRPLRRRLDLYEITYLVTPTIEAELLTRLVSGHEAVWDGEEDRMSDGLMLDGIEVAPHGIEALAYYDVSSRIESEPDIDKITKARLYDGETIEIDGMEITIEDLDEDLAREDGRNGIPCTVTRDVISEMVSESRSNDDPVVMPRELLDALSDKLDDSPVFSHEESRAFTELSQSVADWILDNQESDVLKAMLADHIVPDEEISEYIEHVYCWGTDEDTVEPDPFKMKVFETEHLGRFSDSHYELGGDNNSVSKQVRTFRQESVIDAVSAYIYERRGDGYTVDLDDVDVTAVPALRELVTDYDWDDVARTFDNLDPEQWDDPLDGTQTETVKENTVDNMVEMFDYTNESARRTSDVVMDLLGTAKLSGGDV